MTAFFCFCFFLHCIHLCWKGSGQPQLQTLIYSTYKATQLFHDFSLLPVSISSITSSTLYGAHGVFQGLWYCTKKGEKHARIIRDHFLLWYTIYGRNKLLMQRWLASHSILSGAHCNSNRRWLQNYYSSIVCTKVNCIQLRLNTAVLCLFIFHLQMVPGMACVCIHKFW